MHTRLNTQIIMSLLALVGATTGAFNISYADEIKKKFGQEITVYKTPTCGCCGKWVDHLRRDGFKVNVHNLANLDEIKTGSGVPAALRSCHTAVVEGYTIEGHVPMRDIWRLLQERPAVTGIGVPGMPLGSPGMESSRSQPYKVYTFGGQEPSSVFAEH